MRPGLAVILQYTDVKRNTDLYVDEVEAESVKLGYAWLL